MGPELATALLLGGTGASILGAQQQRREQQRILGRAQQQTAADQDRAIQSVQTEAQRVAPTQRAQDIAAMQKQAAARTMADLEGAGGATIDTAGGAGAVSDDFARAKAQRTASEGDRMSAIAQELAAVRAPQDVATEGALRRSDLAERLASLWSSSKARSQAAANDASAVDMPLYGTLGQVASAVGGASLLGGAAPGLSGVAELGEGVASGVPAWDAAMAATPAASVPSSVAWWQKAAAPMSMFGAVRGKTWSGR